MLDERQSQVRDHTHGPLLVLAVAGSGKTTSVIHRAAHRVGDGVPPDEMLLLTFSRKAAAEMRDRLGGLLDTVSGRSAATGTGAKEYRQSQRVSPARCADDGVSHAARSVQSV